jgi:flagellar assembly protein FliH
MEEKNFVTIAAKKIVTEEEYEVDEKSKFRLEPPKFLKKKLEMKIMEEEQKLKALEDEINRLNEEISKKQEELSKLQEKFLEEANEKASEIIEEAEKVAFNKIKSYIEEKNRIIEETNKEKENILAEARKEAQKIISETRAEAEEIKKKAYDEGYKKGLEDGFREGKKEIEVLATRLHEITSYIVKKREEIIQKSEREVVELALEIVKKILKEITEKEREIVIRQIKYALSKLAGETKFIIRVNPRDLEITASHKEEFIKILEKNGEIKIFEDPFVEPGGCIVETDTTTIDLKIFSQLQEIEEKIKSMLP